MPMEDAAISMLRELFARDLADATAPLYARIDAQDIAIATLATEIAEIRAAHAASEQQESEEQSEEQSEEESEEQSEEQSEEESEEQSEEQSETDAQVDAEIDRIADRIEDNIEEEEEIIRPERSHMLRRPLFGGRF